MWVLRCKMVTPEGRCGIYEYRPELGRSFQPGGDALCIQDPDPGGYRGSIMKRVTKIIAEEGTTLTSIQDLIKEAAQKGDAE